jgi:hypothetical protein
VIEARAETVKPFLDGTVAEIGSAGDDYPRGFAAGMGIDDANSSHNAPQGS